MKTLLIGLTLVALIVVPPIVAELLTAGPIGTTITLIISLIALVWFISGMLQAIAENE